MLNLEIGKKYITRNNLLIGEVIKKIIDKEEIYEFKVKLVDRASGEWSIEKYMGDGCYFRDKVWSWLDLINLVE